MKTALITGVAVAAIAAIAPAIAQTAPAAPAPGVAAPAANPGRMMREHSRDEVVAKVREHFAKMDTNRDGFVTKAEAEAVRTQMRAQFAANHAERAKHRQERSEMRREHTFERLDSNNDGSISRAEFDAAHAAKAGMRDRNADGKPDARGMAGAMRKMHRGMGHFDGQMFEMADANKDGRLTLQEAQNAALSRFDTADVNRDGKITRDEMMQHRQQRRAQHKNS